MRRAALLAATALLPACATAPVVPSPSFEASPPVADEALMLEAERLWPLGVGSSTWSEIEGPAFTWTVSRDASGTIHSDEGGHRVMVLRASNQGGREALQVDKPSDDSRTIFDPPLTLCPATLRCGEPFASTSAALVVRMESGEERDLGTAQRVTELLGTSVVTCPALGRGTVMVVRTSLETRLGMAVASVETTRWIHPEQGAVAERTAERVSVLGFSARERVRTSVRLPERPANPTAGAVEAP